MVSQNLTRASDEVLNAVKGLREEVVEGGLKAKPLQNLEEAITNFKATNTPSAQVTRDLQEAINAAKKQT